ncbi:hypothetical protein D9M71_824190 [compost metagenome]
MCVRGRANINCQYDSGQRMLAGHGMVDAALSCATGCTDDMKYAYSALISSSELIMYETYGMAGYNG